MPVFGPLIGYTKESRAKSVHDACNAASTILKRPVTQEEANTICYHALKAQRTTSYGTFLGAAAGAYRAYQTADTLRMPFYNPSPEMQESVRSGIGKTPVGRMVTHAMRGSLYIFGLGMVGGLIATSYGASVAAVSMQKDPRLSSFNDALKEIMKERRSGIPRDATPVPGQTPPQPRTGWPATTSPSDDDMSPSGGSGLFSDASTDTGVLSDQRMRSKQISQRPDPRSSPTQNRENTFRMDKVTSQPRNFDSTDDDASPTAGAPPLTSSGSAWDRVRQQSASGQSSQQASRTGVGYPASRSMEPGRGPTGRGTQREQRDGATLGDSFTFSSTEEERQLAKAEAQKEFDARIEKERRGQDFDEGGKKW